MHYIKFEIKKLKGSGLIIGMMLITVASAAFFGYAGYVEDRISADILHITALDIFAKIILPLFLSALIMRSFFIERKNDGIVNCYVNDIPVQKVYRAKIGTAYLLGLFYFMTALLTAAFFVHIKGQNPWMLYVKDYKLIVLFIVGVVTVVNVTAILCILLPNMLLPGIIAAGATIFASFTNFIGIPYMNPWGYFEMSLYYRGLENQKVVMMLAVSVLSCITVWCQIAGLERKIMESN